MSGNPAGRERRSCRGARQAAARRRAGDSFAGTLAPMTNTLITGGNKGLGFETARRLINLGHTVTCGGWFASLRACCLPGQFRA